MTPRQPHHGAILGCARLLHCLLIGLALGTSAATAQDDGQKPTVKQTDAAGIEITIEGVQAQLKQVEESTQLDAAVKEKALEVLKETVNQLTASNDWRAKAAEFEKAREEAPNRLKTIKEELAKPAVEPKPDVPPQAQLTDLEQRLTQAETDLAAAKKETADLATEYHHRDDRRLAIPKLVTAAKERLEDVRKQLEAPPSAGEPPRLTEVKRTLLMVRKQAIKLEIDAYNAELLSYDTRGELLTARRDQASRHLTQAEKLAQAWSDIVNEARKKDAEKVVKEAKDATKTAKGIHPSVAKIAKGNAELAEVRTGEDGLAAKIEGATKDLDSIKGKLTKMEADFKGVKEKVKAAGLTEAISVLLREERNDLPPVRAYRRSISARDNEIGKIQLQMLNYEDQRTELVDLEDEVGAILSGLDTNVPKTERDGIEKSARDLLQARRDLLEALIKDHDAYFTKLIALNTEERQLIVQIEAYMDYVDEQILWFRSTSALGLCHLGDAAKATRWLLGRKQWGEVAAALLGDAKSHPHVYGVALLLFLSLLIVRPRLRRRLQVLAEMLTKSGTDSFVHTIRASVLTVLLAVVWPSVLGFFAWRLRSSPHASEFARGIGAALHTAALLFLSTQVLRKVCLPRGLAEEHFRWDPEVATGLRRNLTWLMAIELPVFFLITVLSWHNNEHWCVSLGRFAFIIGMVTLSVFARIVLRPTGYIMRDAIKHNQGGWIARLRHVWYGLAVGLPIALAVASALGYHYTAVQFEHRVIKTIILAVGLLLANALLERWLFVLRRRLAVRKAQQKREAQEAAPVEEKVATGALPRARRRAALDLYEMAVEARKVRRSAVAIVLFVGLWAIWVDVLPALGILHRVELWYSIASTAKEVTRPDGTPGIETVEQQMAITLAHVGLAILILVVAFVAAKNLPGLLEMAILQRMHMDYGIMYAISSITTYVITVVGIVVAFAEIGIGWSKVQWLIAAMTVGLGFGLQEIFANFVSGMIILFERPMRVGDVVTVGDTTGTVTSIRIRATTIIDWDRKEMVVPNKEFVTGRIVNWSLSDSIVRLIITVGAAYGSDTDLIKKTLLDVAKRNPTVLDDPEPRVVFAAFGDSTYNYELRVFVPDVQSYILVRHDLNDAIKKGFDKAGIEIAFPQRDIHIRSVEQAFPITDARQQPPPASPFKEA